MYCYYYYCFSPPGTGKTKTILGIIGSYLTSKRPGAPPPPTKPQPGNTNMRRIMICAPSNAAVDELVLRLKDGIKGFDGRIFKPSVVRLGRTDAINSNVREFTLEELVDKKLESYDKESQNKYNGDLRKTQNEQLSQRDLLRKQLSSCKNPDEEDSLRSKILDLTKKIKETGHKLDLQREEIHVNTRRRDIERRKFQTAILQGCNVVCATLSGSAHHVLLSLQMYFETIVIDEAAQSVELSALIPLKYGCKQCIMVGDPNQLPPTVLSQEAANLKYEQSLFVRMFANFPERVHMLDVQFRMHPEISRFPSAEFYRDKLKDGAHNHVQTRREWHFAELFGPYRFFDVSGQQEQSTRTKSLFNRAEATVAFELYKLLEGFFGREFLNGKIGIISPYKEQVNVLKKTFQRKFGDSILKEIDFNTIDGFQGQEKDIIIMSCVRAQQDKKGVGFLGDTRRMNVAITRAKSSLWVLGNEKSLIGNPVWKRLVDDAKDRNVFTHVTDRFFTNPKLQADLRKAAIFSSGKSSDKIVPKSNSVTSLPSISNNYSPAPSNGNTPSNSKLPLKPSKSVTTRESYPINDNEYEPSLPAKRKVVDDGNVGRKPGGSGTNYSNEGRRNSTDYNYKNNGIPNKPNTNSSYGKNNNNGYTNDSSYSSYNPPHKRYRSEDNIPSSPTGVVPPHAHWDSYRPGANNGETRAPQGNYQDNYRSSKQYPPRPSKDPYRPSHGDYATTNNDSSNGSKNKPDSKPSSKNPNTTNENRGGKVNVNGDNQNTTRGSDNPVGNSYDLSRDPRLRGSSSTNNISSNFPSLPPSQTTSSPSSSSSSSTNNKPSETRNRSISPPKSANNQDPSRKVFIKKRNPNVFNMGRKPPRR